VMAGQLGHLLSSDIDARLRLLRDASGLHFLTLADTQQADYAADSDTQRGEHGRSPRQYGVCQFRGPVSHSVVTESCEGR
jgi:hypothetical protein